MKKEYGLANKTSIPYQKLIDLYLLDRVKRRKKPKLDWESAA